VVWYQCAYSSIKLKKKKIKTPHASLARRQPSVGDGRVRLLLAGHRRAINAEWASASRSVFVRPTKQRQKKKKTIVAMVHAIAWYFFFFCVVHKYRFFLWCRHGISSFARLPAYGVLVSTNQFVPSFCSVTAPPGGTRSVLTGVASNRTLGGVARTTAAAPPGGLMFFTTTILPE